MTPKQLSRRIGAAAFGATLVACGNLFEVDNTRDILSEDLNTIEAIPALLTGVAGDFSAVYMYGALTTGYSSHELQNVGSMTGWREIENGFANNQGSVGTFYNNASRALFVADNAVDRLKELLPDAASRVETARAMVYSGYVLLILADNFCRVTIAGGPPITPAETYARAEARFTEAIGVAAKATGADAQRLQATGGRARARLMLGKFADAKSDAQQIPAGFSFRATYSENSSREYNDIAINGVSTIRKEASVHPKYYTNALYRSDPRTPFLDKGPTVVGADAIRQYVEERKYTARSSPANVMTTNQARLIEAEAEIKLGNPARAIVLINQVRSAAGLPAYSGSTSADDVFKQLLYERSAELWLEGQRYNDLRRTNDPFLNDRAKCYPLSFAEEQSNPHVKP
jgi:hypothetical protein